MGGLIWHAGIGAISERWTHPRKRPLSVPRQGPIGPRCARIVEAFFFFCCCPADRTCPLHRLNRPAAGRAADALRSALGLFPHTTHPPLALRVAPAPSGTATRCSASRQKHGGG